jgi:hypothetical protein
MIDNKEKRNTVLMVAVRPVGGEDKGLVEIASSR